MLKIENLSGVSLALTRKALELAKRLPFEVRSDNVKTVLLDSFNNKDVVVSFLPIGATIRLLEGNITGRDKAALVCVDPSGSYVIPVLSGHGSQIHKKPAANDVALLVAELLGAQAILTTGTDAHNYPSLDTLEGFIIKGNYKLISKKIIDGEKVSIDFDLDWPLPPGLDQFVTNESSSTQVIVTDRTGGDDPGRLYMYPPSLVLGIGSSTRADVGQMLEAVKYSFNRYGYAIEAIGKIATIDVKRSDPNYRELAEQLGIDIDFVSATQLQDIKVPSPSEIVLQSVGTPSVAEACALKVSGASELVIPKTIVGDVTVAAARRRPKGKLSVVGIGPGKLEELTFRAYAAIRHADVVIGYELYVQRVAKIISNNTKTIEFNLGEELERVRLAISLARRGHSVVLVSSGDPQVYAMGSLATEMIALDIEFEIIPGISAAYLASANNGCLLGHDFAFISFSDLLTPREIIKKRLKASLESDFVVVIYNPTSIKRREFFSSLLQLAVDTVGGKRLVLIAKNVGRDNEQSIVCYLSEIDLEAVDMNSLLIIGSSQSKLENGLIFTPRGYLS